MRVSECLSDQLDCKVTAFYDISNNCSIEIRRTVRIPHRPTVGAYNTCKGSGLQNKQSVNLPLGKFTLCLNIGNLNYRYQYLQYSDELKYRFLSCCGQELKSLHSHNGITLSVKSRTPNSHRVSHRIDGHNASSYTTLARQTDKI